MIAGFEIAAMTTVLILSILSAVVATFIAYVIGRWGRTSKTVTSSISAVVTKDTACQADEETTILGQFIIALCFTLTALCLLLRAVRVSNY